MATTIKPRTPRAKKPTATQPEAEAPEPETPSGDESPSAEAETTKRTRVSAATLVDPAYEAIKEAGEAGIGLKDLTEKLGVPYRVGHNVVWHLEGKPAKGGGEPKDPDSVKIERKPGRSLVFTAK